MSTNISWLLPIILLPGVALLIMSTSIRYGQIHEELHHLLKTERTVSALYCTHLRQRARFLRNALLGLYFSVGAFAIGSLLGALFDLMQGQGEFVVLSLAFVGIVTLVYTAVVLVRESWLSLQVIEHHLDMFIFEEGESATKN
jgi:hypothetical protein